MQELESFHAPNGELQFESQIGEKTYFSSVRGPEPGGGAHPSGIKTWDLEGPAYSYLGVQKSMPPACSKVHFLLGYLLLGKIPSSWITCGSLCGPELLCSLFWDGVHGLL